MDKYPIEKWIPSLSYNGVYLPMVIIKPDLKLLEFVKRNSYVISVELRDTGTKLDNKIFLGYVEKSTIIPNHFSLTLQVQWNEHPPKTGNLIVKT